MVSKVNGAVYSGIWVEKKVNFVKVTFSKDITALLTADLSLLNTSTPVTGSAVATSGFGVVESAIVKALKAVQATSVILGVSKYDVSSTSIDVMVGYANGFFSDVNGVISTGNVINGAVAQVTTAGTNVAVGDFVSVNNNAATFSLSFAAFKTLPVATFANGDLDLGPGSTPGSNPVNSTVGNYGYYPGK